MINTMVETFASFAATGDPNNREILDEWKTIITKDLPFSCLNINQDEIKMMPLPESERLKTWNDIFNRENIDLY